MKWKIKKRDAVLLIVIFMLVGIIIGLMLQYNQLVDAYNLCATELNELNQWRFLI